MLILDFRNMVSVNNQYWKSITNIETNYGDINIVDNFGLWDQEIETSKDEMAQLVELIRNNIKSQPEISSEQFDLIESKWTELIEAVRESDESVWGKFRTYATILKSTIGDMKECADSAQALIWIAKGIGAIMWLWS